MLQNNLFDWAVVGAGPAGIAAVGKLMDNQVSPDKILWVDPSFTVGDFGAKWRNVPSNTTVKLFLKFLQVCDAFNYSACEQHFALNDLVPESTCDLSFMADPLAWVTQQLKPQVNAITGCVQQLKLHNRTWHLGVGETTLYAKNVILAVGAEPKTLASSTLETISLATALDKTQLAQQCSKKDTVAVYGSSHSAILVLRNLIEHCAVNKVINFYQSPLRYAIHLGDWILFDNTGLKGSTAEWARTHIDGIWPEKLHRVLLPCEDKHIHLLECTKAIFAIGFEKRTIPVEGITALTHNTSNGIIAPGLFGFGIAFPETKADRFGSFEDRVGLWKFMEYITQIMPVWLRYHA